MSINSFIKDFVVKHAFTATLCCSVCWTTIANAENIEIVAEVGSVHTVTKVPKIYRYGLDQCHYNRIVRAKVLDPAPLGTFELVDVSGRLDHVKKMGHDECFGMTMNYKKVEFRAGQSTGTDFVTIRVWYDDYTREELYVKIVVWEPIS